MSSSSFATLSRCLARPSPTIAGRSCLRLSRPQAKSISSTPSLLSCEIPSRRFSSSPSASAEDSRRSSWFPSLLGGSKKQDPTPSTPSLSQSSSTSTSAPTTITTVESSQTPVSNEDDAFFGDVADPAREAKEAERLAKVETESAGQQARRKVTISNEERYNEMLERRKPKVATPEKAVAHIFDTGKFRIHPRKLRHVADQIRGKPIDWVLLQMKFSDKQAARDHVYEALLDGKEAAIKKGMDASKLVLSHVWVNKGRYTKFLVIMGRGRAGRGIHPESRMNFILSHGMTYTEKEHQRRVRGLLKVQKQGIHPILKLSGNKAGMERMGFGSWNW